MTCDLARGRIPSGALAGADVVIHLAWDMRAPGPENLMAGAALFTAAEEAGAGRIVHLELVVVHDGWPDADLDWRTRPGQARVAATTARPRSGWSGGCKREAFPGDPAADAGLRPGFGAVD